MTALLTRRALIGSAAAMVAAGAMPGVAFANAATDRRLIFIIQRGAADGLGTVAPTDDPAYAPARGALAEEAWLPLNGMFGLNPAMPTVARMFAARQARFIHAVASVYRDRSHFDAQNLLEGGGSRPYGEATGWLGRLLPLLPQAERPALAIAQAVPLALRGPADVTTYAPSRLPQASDDLIARVSAMYADDAALHPVWENALRTRDLAGDIGGNAGRNGAELGALTATLLTPEDGARVAMIETGGWDTHNGQRGRLAAQLRGLDALIGAVREGLGQQWARSMVIVATEFGRTVAVNGTQGTDHGTASVAMFMGGAISGGGEVVADWPGLAPARLFEGRDLMPTASLERSIADAVAAHYALEPARVRRALFSHIA